MTVGFRKGDHGPQLRPFQEWLNRKFASYSKIKIDEYFGNDEEWVVSEAQRRYGLNVTGVADDAFLMRAGYIHPPKRFPLQGVSYNTTAFLNPDPSHSYVDMVGEGAIEGMRLAMPMLAVPKVLLSYSGGADTASEVLWRWPADRRDEIKMVCAFGDPSRRPGPTLMGDNPPGQGIGGRWAPEWVWPVYYNFSLPGDMYPCSPSESLLPQLYQILVRAELSLEFATYLFGVLTSQLGPLLLGTLSSALPGAGALSGILSMVTPGLGARSTILDPMQLVMMLPAILSTAVAALKFLFTGAHGHYGDQPQPAWGNLTGVDKAAQLIIEKVPSATVFTFPGTWANWDQGFPFEVWARLP